MSVAVVIANYNYGQYLQEAIESALAQTMPVEVIVSDDGSTDDSVKIAKRYGSEITLIQGENGGVSAARNRAIEVATADHILPLDSDDVLFPNACEAMHAVGDKIVRGACESFGDFTRRTYFNPQHEHFTAHEATHRNPAWACSMFPRQAWVDVGGYDEDPKIGYEDWDFWVRCLHAGYKLGTTHELVYGYRKHGESLVSRCNDRGDEIRAYLYNKWKRMGIG